MREELIHMKHYIATCRLAQESGLLKELDWGKNLIHNSDTFSLDDLIDIKDGTLIPKIEVVYNRLMTHIKEQCEVNMEKTPFRYFKFRKIVRKRNCLT